MRGSRFPIGPLASGAPYWYWLGGRPALDFVNTRRERWRRNVECLVDDGDPSTGSSPRSCCPRPRPPPPGLADEARALREAIDAGVRAAHRGRAGRPGRRCA